MTLFDSTALRSPPIEVIREDGHVRVVCRRCKALIARTDEMTMQVHKLAFKDAIRIGWDRHLDFNPFCR